jgi:hypothetical protein
MNGIDDEIPSQEPRVDSPPPMQQPTPYPPPQYQQMEQMRIEQEIEELRRKVGRFFTVYEVQVGSDAVAFYCRIMDESLEENFELLRNLLKPDYIPLLTYEGGEHVIYVMKKPRVKYKGTRVNLILLLITLVTTTIAGSLLWISYDTARQGLSTSEIDALAALFSPVNLMFGALFFSLPLLTILGTHESAHYIMAKKHGVAASLPFFIPMMPPLGTLGAVISMREPIPNKKALMDIGAAGPIAGLLVAIPVTIVGLYLTDLYAVSPQTTEPGTMILYNPLLLMGLNSLFPTQSDLLAHPTFFAGWVGILVTALNLLPAGQLDGGHIVRALFGENTRFIGIATVITMIFLAFIFNYFGFVLLIVIVMVLGGGLSHPPPLNDITKLDKRRVMVGVLALVIFAVSFHPAPFQNADLGQYGFELGTDLNETIASPGGNALFNVTVLNTGNVQNDAILNLTMNQTKITEGWNVTIIRSESETPIYNLTDEGALHLSLEEDKSLNFTVNVSVPTTASIGDNATIRINLGWSSWSVNDWGDTEKKQRKTHEDVVIWVE